MQPIGCMDNELLPYGGNVLRPSRMTDQFRLDIPRAVHLDGDVIGCHQCIAASIGNAPASPDMRPPP